MANFLSEDEIEEILNAYRAGANMDEQSSISGKIENYEKIRLYNFKIPNRFTKEQLRALRGVYETFATLLGSHLSGLLRIFCQVELLSVEEHTFSEFNNALVNPVLLAIINLEPLQGSTLLEISPSLAYGVIDRLLGGTGSFSNTYRNYTEIEVALMEKLVGQYLELMHESWSKVFEINPRMERIETSSQFAQIVPFNETIAIVTFAVKIGEVEGMMNYCVPHMGIEAAFKDLKTKRNFFQTQVVHQESKADVILKSVEKAALTMTATFNDTNVQTKDVMSLSVGDVLTLDHRVNEPVQLKINDMVKYTGYIGEKNNKLRIKLNEIVKEEVV